MMVAETMSMSRRNARGAPKGNSRVVSKMSSRRDPNSKSNLVSLVLNEKNLNVTTKISPPSSPLKRKTRSGPSQHINEIEDINDIDSYKNSENLSTPEKQIISRPVRSAIVTPSTPHHNESDDDATEVLPPKALRFEADDPTTVEPPRQSSSTKNIGPFLSEIPPVPQHVKCMYKEINLKTGRIGGNASGGPIYGELTVGSMHKMIHLMIQHTGLDKDSTFIDVGSGLGKPNLHVAADPGVYLSVGIECEKDRYLLGLHNLRGVLGNSTKMKVSDDTDEFLRCGYVMGDIMDAKSFSPFSHVYMFSIGFPPPLWLSLVASFNRSTSPWLICYHGPRQIIEKHGFNVELVVKMPTSMHGSSEVHSGYIYRRVESKKIRGRKGKCNSSDKSVVPLEDGRGTVCDVLFKDVCARIRGSFTEMKTSVDREVLEHLDAPRARRTRKKNPIYM